ncbi:hypothetical protein EJP77_15610 [Paenibacillus zeisoli]|uniref:Uncharacterized protein n=1 Tax=Paenibacillus zeisoli TaxID=2496267 RepID=A0A3S1D7W6_9BACL|nr:hypothetical protein [Paenibacillus zeisoli]RUT29142.1 hypothetical protein EJP77_15610 [Paenibacillus zeisoli]
MLLLLGQTQRRARNRLVEAKRSPLPPDFYRYEKFKSGNPGATAIRKTIRARSDQDAPMEQSKAVDSYPN